MKMSRWPISLALAVVFLVGVPISDLFNGFALSIYGSSRISIFFKGLIIPIIIIIFFMRRINKSQLLLATSVWLLILLLIAVPTLAGDSRVNPIDLTVLSRGPLLLSLVLLLIAFMKHEESEIVSDAYFKVSWWVITGSIIVLNFLGMSLATYEGSDAAGMKGVYAAGNEVTIVYMLSWWHLVFGGNRSRRAKVAYTGITLSLLFLIGTKGGFVVFGIVALWQTIIWAGLTPIKATSIFTGAAALVLVFASDIFLFIGPFLKGWDRLLFFIQKHDAVTAMTGGRFLSLPYILTIFDGFGFFEFFFGLGFSDFWQLVSDGSVESDVIDLFGGGGVFGIMLFYGIIVYCMIVTLRTPRLVKWGGLFWSIILYSVFVGHVAFAATPTISVAVAVSAFLGARRRENRNHSFLVQQSQFPHSRKLHS